MYNFLWWNSEHFEDIIWRCFICSKYPQRKCPLYWPFSVAAGPVMCSRRYENQIDYCFLLLTEVFSTNNWVKFWIMSFSTNRPTDQRTLIPIEALTWSLKTPFCEMSHQWWRGWVRKILSICMIYPLKDKPEFYNKSLI